MFIVACWILIYVARNDIEIHLPRDEREGRYILLVGVWVIFFVGARIHKRAIEKNKTLLKEVYWTKQVEDKLWYSKLSYPLIAVGGDRSEVIHIVSYDRFQIDYPFWIDAKYIVDATWIKYTTKKTNIEDIFRDDQKITKIMVYPLTQDKETLTFEQVKELVVNTTQKHGKKSAYYEILDELKKASDIHQLVEVMEKGNY